MHWTNKGRGRYSATSADGQEYVIVPELGHFGNNVRGYQAWAVGPGDRQELTFSARRLGDVFKHFEDQEIS